MPPATAPFILGVGGATVGCTLRLGCAGALKGVPTGMSQRWFGWPCAGFKPAVASCVEVSVTGADVGRLRGAVVIVSFCSASEQATKPKTAADNKTRVTNFM